MKKILRNLFKHKYFQSAFILFLIGIFLRFYKIYDFVTFLGDQGRDVIIMRRILTFEHFPAIGPVTSIGNVYLGPFYYYFMAPWLLLSGFNPIGPAIGVAVFSSIFILVAYIAVRDLFNERIALIYTSLITFSAILIDFSRYSWNPNMLPIFAFLTYYLLIKAIKTGKSLFYLLTGMLLSFCIQLHYIALSLIPAAGLVLIIDYFMRRPEIKKTVKNWVLIAFSFIFFSLPLVVFDLRHQFMNSKNFLSLFFKTGAVRGHRVDDLVSTFERLIHFAVFPQFAQPLPVLLLLLTIFIIAGILLLRRDIQYKGLSVFFFVSLLMTSTYSGIKHPHYLGSLYPFCYLFIAYLISTIAKKVDGRIISFATALTIFLLSFGEYHFLQSNPSRQIDHAKKGARVIFDNTTKEKVQVTGLPDKYADSTYRYFTELWGKRSLEKDSLDRADELFVICEKDCKIIGDPQWDIAFFAPTKIVNEWQVDHVRIYKLVR
jgi:4-amino-4-deoxy-L-arabinose transferase-like glycosyltransferase